MRDSRSRTSLALSGGRAAPSGLSSGDNSAHRGRPLKLDYSGDVNGGGADIGDGVTAEVRQTGTRRAPFVDWELLYRVSRLWKNGRHADWPKAEAAAYRRAFERANGRAP